MILMIIGISILLISSSYKSVIYKIFNDYEEECYQYKIHYWNETYCSSSIGLGDWKNTNEEYPCCDDNKFNFTWDNGTKGETRWCMGSPFDKTFLDFTDECDVYHLVRKNAN